MAEASLVLRRVSGGAELGRECGSAAPSQLRCLESKKAGEAGAEVVIDFWWSESVTRLAEREVPASGARVVARARSTAIQSVASQPTRPR